MYVAYHRVLSCALRFRVWMLGGYVWSQESDSMILVDPFQLRILCDWSRFLLKQFVHFWWVFHVRDMSLYLPSLHLLQPWSYPDSSIKERVRPMVSCAIEKIVKNTHLQKKKKNSWEILEGINGHHVPGICFLAFKHQLKKRWSDGHLCTIEVISVLNLHRKCHVSGRIFTHLQIDWHLLWTQFRTRNLSLPTPL